MRVCRACSFLLGLLLASRAAIAQPARAPVEVSAAQKDEARSHFDRGLQSFDGGDFGAALAEFNRSRELFPTRVATKNAGVCLRKENRLDESLDTFQALLHDFPDLSPSDRAFVDQEIAGLVATIGTLEISGAAKGATIVIDSRTRGTFPSAPIRVSAGAHLVRISAPGYLPFEQRVDVAGRQNVALKVDLVALTAQGQLRVVEAMGKELEVVVDNVVVGKTPYSGVLAVGEHMVLLRGDGAVGTQPVKAPIRTTEVTTLSLAAEELRASARVVPTPAGAKVYVDGVLLGRGVWEGRLRTGAHRVEVVDDGFVPFERSIQLPDERRVVLPVELERDPTSPMWTRPSRFVLEIDGAFALAPLFGGDVAAACTGSCASTVALGAIGTLHAGYELRSGLGFALDAGYLSVWKNTRDRQTAFLPFGLPANTGTASDKLRVSGLLLGASGAYHRGAAFPLTLRLGAGVLLGSVRDARSGNFTGTDPRSGAAFEFAASDQSDSTARYFYIAPEARVGMRLGEHVEVSAGFEAMFLVALTQPRWAGSQKVLASAAPGSSATEGVGGFEGTVAGSLIVVLAPSLGARYEF